MDNRIKVGVRVRPLMSNEIETGAASIVNVEQERIVSINMPGRKNVFEYDWSFGHNSNQNQVYQSMCKPLIDNIFEGFNATFFAYGQTELSKEGNAKVEIELSYIEIYLEECYDLLSKTGERVKLDLRETIGGDTNLEGLQSWAIYDIDTAAKYLSDAAKVRATGATAMNSVSSRSHAICTLTVRVIYEDRAVVSKLHLVDLAGSERAKKTQASGDTFQEGISINKGLLALGNVVSALVARAKGNAATTATTAATATEKENHTNAQQTTESNKDSKDNKDVKEKSKVSAAGLVPNVPHYHIPYRESKLTRLLKDALGGNGMTVLLTCISPSDSNMDETMNSLRFASRVTSIINKVKVNLDTNTDNMSLLKEVNYLRKQLAEMQNKHDIALKTTSINNSHSTMLVTTGGSSVGGFGGTDIAQHDEKMVTVAIKLTESLKGVLITCLEEGAFLEDSDVESIQDELDSIYKLLEIKKPSDKKIKNDNVKQITNNTNSNNSDRSGNTSSTAQTKPDMWSLESLMSMDMSDKTLLNTINNDLFNNEMTSSGANSDLFANLNELDFNPPIMKAIEDIKYLEKTLKKRLAAINNSTSSNKKPNTLFITNNNGNNNSNRNSLNSNNDNNSDDDNDNNDNEDAMSVEDTDAMDGSDDLEGDDNADTMDCAGGDTSGPASTDSAQQQQSSSTAATAQAAAQAAQLPPRSEQEKKALLEVKKKEGELQKMTSITVRYQQTINDLNSEISNLQKDQQKLQQKQAQNKAKTNSSTSNSGNNNNHNSAQQKESFEDIKLKRDLVEKSRLLDEKVKILRQKETELLKINNQKSSLAKEVESTNKQLQEYKQKRVELLKKMKSNSATFQTEKLKLKQNELTVLRRENETKQTLQKLENTLNNKEKVFKAQLDSKEREKALLKEQLLKQQNAKTFRENKYVKTSDIKTATTNNNTNDNNNTNSNNNTNNNSNTVVTLTKSKVNEISCWLNNEISDHTNQVVSSEDTQIEIAARSKAARELQQWRLKKKDLQTDFSDSNSIALLNNIDANIRNLAEEVQTRTNNISTLIASNNKYNQDNNKAAQNRFKPLSSLIESKLVNELLFAQLSKAQSHERAQQRKIEKLQDQLLKFHKQQLIDGQQNKLNTNSNNNSSIGNIDNSSAIKNNKRRKSVVKFAATTKSNKGSTEITKQQATKTDEELEHDSEGEGSDLSDGSESEDEDSEEEDYEVYSVGEMDETFYPSDDEEVDNDNENTTVADGNVFVGEISDSDDSEVVTKKRVRNNTKSNSTATHNRTDSKKRRSEDSVSAAVSSRLSGVSEDSEVRVVTSSKNNKKRKNIRISESSFGDSVADGANDASFGSRSSYPDNHNESDNSNSDNNDSESDRPATKKAKKTSVTTAPATTKPKKNSTFDSNNAASAVSLEVAEEMLFEGKMLSKHTVKDLKGFLSARGLTVSGVKDDLIRRLATHMFAHHTTTNTSGDDVYNLTDDHAVATSAFSVNASIVEMPAAGDQELYSSIASTTANALTNVSALLTTADTTIAAAAPAVVKKRKLLDVTAVKSSNIAFQLNDSDED